MSKGNKSYRDRLEAEIAAIEAEDRQGRDDRAVVTLDQQSVGRLSRMDALQRQAMAQAAARRRGARRQRVEAALRRLDAGEFGFCEECGDEIAARRLDLDPAVSTCVSCARG